MTGLMSQASAAAFSRAAISFSKSSASFSAAAYASSAAFLASSASFYLSSAAFYAALASSSYFKIYAMNSSVNFSLSCLLLDDFASS
jgi:hypothetical protein